MNEDLSKGISLELDIEGALSKLEQEGVGADIQELFEQIRIAAIVNGTLDVDKQELRVQLEGLVNKLVHIDPFLATLLYFENTNQEESIEGATFIALSLEEPKLKDINDKFSPQKADHCIRMMQDSVPNQLKLVEELDRWFKGINFLADSFSSPEELRAAISAASEGVSKQFSEFLGATQEVLIAFGISGIDFFDNNIFDNIDASKKVFIQIVLAFIYRNNAYRRVAGRRMELDSQNVENEKRQAPRRQASQDATVVKVEKLVFEIARDYKQFVNEVAVIGENGEILELKAMWKQIFEIKNGIVTITKSAATFHRKQKEKFHNALKASGQFNLFDSYISLIGILDVLTDWVEDNLDNHIQRLKSIYENIILPSSNIENLDEESLRDLIKKSFNELKISLKDSGDGVSGTPYATTESLMNPGRKIIFELDVIGLGAMVLNTTGIQIGEIAKKYDRGVRDFDTNILNANDPITKVMRRDERLVLESMRSIFGQDSKITLDSSGGDEIRFVIEGVEGDINNYSELLEKICEKHNVRMVGVQTDLTIDPEFPEKGVLNIIEIRKRIDCLIKKIKVEEQAGKKTPRIRLVS